MRPASGALGVMACALAMLTACNAGDVTRPVDAPLSKPADLVLASAVVGTQLSSPVRLVVTRADGSAASNQKVRWSGSEGSALSSAESMTDAKGVASVTWTLGTKAGTQQLVAAVAGLEPVVFAIQAKADKPARIDVNADQVRLTVLGDTATLQAAALDRFGNASDVRPTFQLETGADVISLITDAPAVIARQRGTGSVLVSAENATARVTVNVEPATPRPTRVVGDTIRPGVPFAIDGDSFAWSPEFVQVSVNGVKADILSSTRTRIEAVIPAASMPCQATAAAHLRVSIASSVGELEVPLRVATRLSLAKGESASLLDYADVKCAELAPASGNSGAARFIVAVINTSVAASATSAFELRGTGAGTVAGQSAVSLDPQAMQLRSTSGTVPASMLGFQKSEDEHGDHLDHDRDLLRRSGSPLSSWKSIAASRAGVAAARLPRVENEIVAMKALYNSCGTGQTIQARVVYAGSRAVVLEDVAAPRAGTMDAEYRAIGQEFDAVQYPLLTENLGDPLAMNATMDGDARVTMLFTRFVNDSLPGIAGYVSACNFYPKATFAGSNEDEVFYARVANAAENPAEWRRSMRSTVVHEVKHIASFAERIVRNNPFEESWLEESTARIAEELYSRKFTGGGSWKGNTSYASSVRCEIAQCDDRPLMMWKHFTTLQSYYRGVDTLTPIGAAYNGDFSYYASGWSLVRWAADHYAVSEGQWLKDLVRGGATTGLSNLAQRTGRPIGEMLSDWALANAIDDMPGVTPRREQLSMPSWNTADVMQGLSQSYPGAYQASPLRVRNFSFGQFVLPVGRLRAFSTSYFSFSGNAGGSQLIELTGLNGGAAPGSLRVAVVRVE